MELKVRIVVAEALGLDPDAIDRDTSMENQARWDSLRHMNIVFGLEDALGVRFSDDEIAKLTSVKAIEEALARRH